MAVRIKSHWHNAEQQRSFDDIGGAIAFNSWKIAMDKAINLHGEDFIYRDDLQRIQVISEYLIFSIQLTDRLAHRYLDDPQRQGIVTAMAMKLAEYVEDNAKELLGNGPHHEAFIDSLNQRAAEYSEFALDNDGPSYPFYRHLGNEIQQLMGDSGANRWVIDQVMDADGPEIYQQLHRILRNLLP